jgi:ATP-dependent RNA helicase HelY
LALATGKKAFYTTPIKALSNQKYNDLVRRYGADSVGLLTGDSTINGEASIVVMTTEVLRNMIYAQSSTLDTLGYVVMDEVHYLADRFRGAVWEEVIIHLDQSVRLVSLSATVSNAEEFGDWLEAVRGDTKVIVSERRPVPLWQHVIVQGRGDHPGGILDLYAHTVDPTDPGVNPPINPDLLNVMRRGSDSLHNRGSWGGRGKHGSSQRTGRRGPPRFAVIKELEEANLLPAIYFIFSRAGCDAAVAQCLATGISLTTEQEAEQIRIIAESRCTNVPAEDLNVLGFWSWIEGLTRGIAAHHAGMLPLFKETVEELFSRGLIKAVFATETLALGINMPARTVVMEKLVKWDGTSHVDLTPGEYTQLTGRAGRR